MTENTGVARKTSKMFQLNMIYNVGFLIIPEIAFFAEIFPCFTSKHYLRSNLLVPIKSILYFFMKKWFKGYFHLSGTLGHRDWITKVYDWMDGEYSSLECYWKEKSVSLTSRTLQRVSWRYLTGLSMILWLCGLCYDWGMAIMSPIWGSWPHVVCIIREWGRGGVEIEFSFSVLIYANLSNYLQYSYIKTMKCN